MHQDTPHSLVRFGIARDDITPPVGIYHRMWGAAVHDRAAGVHRPLLATAMAFQPLGSSDTADLQVVVTLDHCLMARREMDELRGCIERATGVPATSLVVLFSHTHAAGLLGQDRIELPGGDLIPAYLDRLNTTVAALVQAAVESLQPAAIQYARGRCDLAAQRDFWDEARGQFVCGFNPAAQADDTLIAARILSHEGQPLATLVNYACHPTTLAWENQQISSDYPGAMREVIEQATDAPCVFLQGASGDLGPKEGFVGDTEVADRNGRQLGYAALSALNSLAPARTRFEYAGPVVSGATIGVWQHRAWDADRTEAAQRWSARRWTVPLEYREELPTVDQVRRQRDQWLEDERQAHSAGDPDRSRDCRAMVERQTRLLARLHSLPAGVYPYRVAAWRMGDAVWVAVQGEPYQQLQTSLRQRFPGTAVLVCSLADEWGPSYLPPADIYGKGIYQETIAVVAPGSLERVIGSIGDELEFLLRESK